MLPNLLASVTCYLQTEHGRSVRVSTQGNRRCDLYTTSVDTQIDCLILFRLFCKCELPVSDISKTVQCNLNKMLFRNKFNLRITHSYKLFFMIKKYCLIFINLITNFINFIYLLDHYE